MRTHEGDALTNLILPIFQLNAEVMMAAQTITNGHDLTPAEWQVLGFVLGDPLSVPGIAAHLGHTRQSVQRLANSVVAKGWAIWQRNPRSRRSPLLVPTEAGRDAIGKLQSSQSQWADFVGNQVSLKSLDAFHTTLLQIINASQEYRETQSPTPQ